MARAKDAANAGMNALLGPSVPGLIPGGGGRSSMGVVTEAGRAGVVLALVGGFHHQE